VKLSIHHMQSSQSATFPLGYTCLFKFFSPTQLVGNCNYDAVMLNSAIRGFGSSLRSDEIQDMCVIYTIRRVVPQFNISISIRQRKGFGAWVIVAGYTQFGGLIRRGDTHKGYRPIILLIRVRFLPLPAQDSHQDDPPYGDQKKCQRVEYSRPY
jgi:hypothetical protein